MATKIEDLFTIGDRVQIHPSHDVWMMGDRFGQVEKLGRKYVHVRMDVSGTLRKFSERYVTRFTDYSVIKSVRIINGKI